MVQKSSLNYIMNQKDLKVFLVDKSIGSIVASRDDYATDVANMNQSDWGMHEIISKEEVQLRCDF